MTEHPDDDPTTAGLDGDASAELASYRIVVQDGADAGMSIVVDASMPTRLLVGHSRACQLVLRDVAVSRRHAAFDLDARGLRVTDLGSRNGTRVDGVRVVEAILEGGERLRIGDTTLNVELVDERPEIPVARSEGFGRVVGASVVMRRLYPLCERVALSELPVVIEGETGTGKELLAEALHEVGPRRAKPFLVFDCAGTPRESAAQALFGDGLPEGAGLFEQADGGTLLVDEVAELGDDAQGRLLRLLDHGEVRLEGGRAVTVDVRVLAATRRDLDKEVQAGRLRDDLFYRLAALRIELPPLREREGDVPLLARLFWKRDRASAGRPLPADLLARYESYAWPGNVRELENAVMRRLALGPFEPASRRDAAVARDTDLVERVLAKNLSLPSARAEIVDEFERRYLAKVLEEHGGNVSRAAAASGVARRYFQILRARHVK